MEMKAKAEDILLTLEVFFLKDKILMMLKDTMDHLKERKDTGRDPLPTSKRWTMLDTCGDIKDPGIQGWFNWHSMIVWSKTYKKLHRTLYSSCPFGTGTRILTLEMPWSMVDVMAVWTYKELCLSLQNFWKLKMIVMMAMMMKKVWVGLAFES